MTLEAYRQQQADAMTEAQLQRAILGTKRAPGLADGLGWRGYHTHRSDRSPAGFPDLVLVRRGWLIFAELKRQDRKAKPSAAQEEWLDDLGEVEARLYPFVTAHVWRPLDLLDGSIERILRESQ